MFFRKKRKTCPDENRMCMYCENAETLGDSGVCICKIKGVVSSEGVCKKFKFDLLKLKPRPIKLPDSSGLFAD